MARRRRKSQKDWGTLLLIGFLLVLYLVVRYRQYAIALIVLGLGIWIYRVYARSKEGWQLAQSSVEPDEIFLDVETLRLSGEVEGGWSSVHKFGLAVAVTWDKSRGFRRWFEADVQKLIEELKAFPRIITYNGDRFDLQVLSGYGAIDVLQKKSRDLLADLHKKVGFRVKLDDLATETLGRQKSGSGLDAVKWWREGKIEKVCNYCEDDVRILMQLVGFARANKCVVVDGRKVRVSW